MPTACTAVRPAAASAVRTVAPAASSSTTRSWRCGSARTTSMRSLAIHGIRAPLEGVHQAVRDRLEQRAQGAGDDGAGEFVLHRKFDPRGARAQRAEAPVRREMAERALEQPQLDRLRLPVFILRGERVAHSLE